MTRRLRTQAPTQKMVQLNEVPPRLDALRPMTIAAGVRAYALESRPIVVIDSTWTELWNADAQGAQAYLARRTNTLVANRAFVWVDPPKDADGALVVSQLEQARIPTRVKPRQTADAILAEVATVVAASEDQTAKTMREVVMGMAEEVVGVDRAGLDSTLDQALTGVGL